MTAQYHLPSLITFTETADHLHRNPQGRVTFWQMARNMTIRWVILGSLFCGLFYLVLKPELDKQDRNMPAMVTTKQWDDMKALKAAGRPIVRPAGPNDAQWAAIVEHLAAVPGPATVLAPFERPQGIRSKLMDRAREEHTR